MPQTLQRLPARSLAALFLAATGAWVLLAAWLWRTPPIDNVEQLVWRSAVEWGYYKHPPLPTWLLAAASPAWPATPLLTYLLAAACMVVTLWLFHALLRPLLGRGDALLAVLAALCLTYATDRLPIYNHNVVMMPFIAAVWCLLWRTTQRPSLAAWAGIGLCLGAGMLAKYQMALVALCVALWWLRIGGWRVACHRWGLALAAVLAALVFAPHLLWLTAHQWAPLTYASDSSLGAHLRWSARGPHAVLWMADWMVNRLAPAWVLVFAAAGVLSQRPDNPERPVPPPDRWQRDFLLLAGFGPMLLTAALCLAGGIYLQMKWSTAFALWTVPAIQVLLPRRWRYGDAPLPRVVWAMAGLLQLLLLAITLHSASLQAREPMRKGAWRQRDFATMARAIDVPVDVINGPYGVAGMLARHLPGQPRVLIDGDLRRSPWLTPTDLAQARTISVWPTCQVPEGARPLARGWAWWPRPAPPPVADGPQAAAEIARRAQASHTGGTAAVHCP